MSHEMCHLFGSKIMRLNQQIITIDGPYDFTDIFGSVKWYKTKCCQHGPHEKTNKHFLTKTTFARRSRYSWPMQQCRWGEMSCDELLSKVMSWGHHLFAVRWNKKTGFFIIQPLPLPWYASSATILGDLLDFGQLFKALICPNLSHSWGIFVKVSKSFIFLVKSFLGNFNRFFAIFFWSHCMHPTYNLIQI